MALLRFAPALALLLPVGLAGCAHRADLASLSAAPAARPPRPVLGPNLAAVTPPPHDANGGYRTINSGLTREGAVWHVRAALNVAAIACRGPGDAGTVASYNAMLATQKAILANANASVRASVKAEGGDADAYMTRLYNYFAMPPAKPGFCAAAATLAPEAATTAPEAFPAFAQTALAALEAPFDAVYAHVDEYRLASAAWDARYGGERPETRFADAGTPPREVAAPLIGSLPIGSDAGSGHYDVPRVMPGHHAVPASAPHLAYADLRALLAWQSPRREALASR